MVYPGGMIRGRHATPVKLARKERQELQSLIRRPTAAQRDVTRARIALMAHEGDTSAAISQELGVSVQTVSQWRQRMSMCTKVDGWFCKINEVPDGERNC